MPYMGEASLAPAPIQPMGGPTLDQYQGAAQGVVKQDRGLLVGTAGLLAGGAVDLVDTVASSIPGLSRGLGIERGDIDRQALNAVDLPGLNDFYNDYQQGIETTSGVLGLVATEVAARRLGAATGAFMQTASKLPYIRRLATLDTEYANAMQTVRNVDSALATRGALGAEQYVGRVTVDRSIYQAGGTFGSVTEEVGRRGAFWKARGVGAAVSARNIAGREALAAVALNQNGFLYDDDMSHNLTWMGLGLAGGAAIEGIAAVYGMRKFVNSDQIRRRFADALDPDEIERGRILWHGKPVTADTLGGPGTFFGGTFTDEVTSLAINAASLRKAPITGSQAEATQLMANRSSLATQHLTQARDALQKVTTKGVSTNGFTRFSMDSRGYGNHADMLLYRDPGAMYGVEQLGGIPEELTAHGIHQAHVARLDERIAETEKQLGELTPDQLDSGVGDSLQQLRRRLDAETKLTPQVAIDGEWMPISEASAIEGFKEPDIKFTADEKRGLKNLLPKIKGINSKDQRGIWEAITESPKGGVSIDSDLVLHLPGNKSLDTADHFDMLRLYRTAQRAIPQLAKFEGPINLVKKPTWFQLDMAEEILQRNPAANVVWPEGMTRDSAQIESFIQKSKALKKWDTKEAQVAAAQEAKGVTYEGQLSKLRVRYNIPRLTAYERGVLGESEHPVEGLLRGMADYSEDEIRKMSVGDIKDAVARSKRIGDVAPVTPGDVKSLSGTSFNYMLDESGQPIKPLFAYTRPFDVASWTQDHVAERLAAANMSRISIATAPSASPMTRQIVGSLAQSPDLAAASRTHELMDIQIQGSLTGSAPQSVGGALGNALRTSEFRDRDTGIMLAASRVREEAARQTRDYTRAVHEAAYGDVIGRLESPRNAHSLLLVDQFHSHAQGWELAAKPVEREPGFRGFPLADTKENRARFKQAFGRDMEKGQILLGPDGKEIVLDDLALEAQTRFNQVTNALIDEKNTVLKAQGLPQIQKRNWYVPAPSTEGKIMGFTIGPDGKTVPNMSVIASTQEQFNRQREAIIKRIDSEFGMGYTFQTQQQIEDFANIWDRAQMDFIDPGTTAIQPGKVSRGVLTGPNVRVNAFAESRKNIHSQFLKHGDDLVGMLMRDSIKGAEARAAIAGTATRNRAGFFREQRYNSIYDLYLQNLQGSSKLNGKGTFFGGGFNWIEGKANAVLEAATPPVSKVFQVTDQWLRKYTPWNSSILARRDFDTIADKLGPYMPFESATQMLEAKGAGALPPTLAKITGGINRFSAAMLLRFMEVAHPIVNLTGIVNAMPAVIRSMTPKNGEEVADYATRVGHNASIFQLKDGTPLGIIDMNKIGARAFKRAWSRESHVDYDYMVRRGFLSQEVAEFHRQFGAIDSPGAMEKFFVGDRNAKGFMKKGLVGWGSVLSDRSEDFSRSWGHMIGLELADHLGIEGQEARHGFAHDIANKMIANYSPQNRPEIFQGALGAPIGLFQSFVQNYYQQLFRYVETKNFAALGHQMAAQSALFGINSLPGWSEFSGLMSKDDGSGDATSALYHRFHGPVGDILGHGVVSNIPKIFGAEGVDLYSRGDVNVRVPGLGAGQHVNLPIAGDVTLPSFPGLSVIGKLWQGIGEGISAFHESLIQRGQLPSVTALGEIASNMIANRPIAGMIEQFMAHGNDTDQYGQLVNDTRSAMEVAYRLIGLRSMRQSQQVQAFYANKNAMEHKAANDEILNLATRSSIRNGTLNKDIDGIMQSYLSNGGDPRNFRRWLKQNYTKATTTRARRQLESVMKNPAQVEQALRLLDAGVSIADDEATPDPTKTWQIGQDDELNQDTESLGTYDGQMVVDNESGHADTQTPPQ